MFHVWLHQRQHQTCTRHVNSSREENVPDIQPRAPSRNPCNPVFPLRLGQREKMLSVLGQPLRHYGTKKEVQFQAKDGTCTSVNLEVTDAARAIVSQERNADTRP